MTNAPLIISVDWPWALGIIGTLLLIAWVGSGRFKGVETDVSWLKKGMDEMKKNFDGLRETTLSVESKLRDLVIGAGNEKKNLFGNASPIRLTQQGDEYLKESGFKDYIDQNKDMLFHVSSEKRTTNPYEVQRFVFDLFDSLPFEPEFDDKLKKFAYENGLDMDILRRIGAIYFRDLCLDEFEMKVADIDSHNPEKKASS